MKRIDSCVAAARTRLLVALFRERAPRQAIAFCLLGLALAACSDSGGGDFADNGGMSGTGISEGTIDGFGSIFVNGVEWDTSSASVELDGRIASEASLRLGMVVRVEGRFSEGASTGIADRVVFDDAIEGPIEADPTVVVPGVIREFTILGQTVRMVAGRTAFAGGASFAGLVRDDVVEVSGIANEANTIVATRIRSVGRFPGLALVEVRGAINGLARDPSGSGSFMLGGVMVQYLAGTPFAGLTRADLHNGRVLEVEGRLRIGGMVIDADRIEDEDDRFGGRNFDRIELEGIVRNCAASTDFCLGRVPVNASGAATQPAGYVPMAGDSVEVIGSIRAGVLVATSIEFEGADDRIENVRVEATLTGVDPGTRTIQALGLEFVVLPRTRFEDKSSVGDEQFGFDDLRVGDYFRIDANESAGQPIEALRIEREDGTPGSDDVKLEGRVTDFGSGPVPTLEILGLPVPIDGTTLYFDAFGASRSEEQFFRNPGDVAIGSIVEVSDDDALDLSDLAEVDEAEISGL